MLMGRRPGSEIVEFNRTTYVDLILTDHNEWPRARNTA